MKIFKFSFLSFIFWAQTLPTFGEPTLPDPGTGSISIFTPLTCDYGPRYIEGKGSNPHIGLDYDIRTGSKAYAVEGGAVTSIKNLNSDIATIKIGDWNYTHMAVDTAILQAYVKDSPNPYDTNHAVKENVIVFRNNAGYPEKALSTYKFNVNYPFYDPSTGIEVAVSSIVSQGEWVFVSRAHLSATDMANHLHLDYKGGAENPLKYVLHSDSNTPVAVLWPKFKRIGLDGQASDFYDDIIFNTFQSLILQAGVDVTQDKDLDKVEISYGMEGDISTTTLNGWAYEPATTSGSIKSTWAPAGKIHISSMVPIASASEEGVYPAKNVVSLDFFKYKWDTRALNVPAAVFQSAPLNSMAKYPDGRYMIQMGAMDITGHMVSTDSLKILDNFRPYVESVVVKDLLGNVKYSRGWTLENNLLVSTWPVIDEPLLPGIEYAATITFSEFVDFSWMQIGPTGPRYYPIATDIPALKKTVYNGNFLVQPGAQRDELRPFIIFGKDLGRNDALALDPGKRGGDGSSGRERTIDPLHELVRDDGGLMRGAGGEDRFHPLRIDAAPPEISWKDRQGIAAGSCIGDTPERCGTEAEPYNINFNTVTFRYADLGSGLKSLRIYKNNLSGELFYPNDALSAPKRAYAVESVIGMPDGKYVQVITDNLGRSTTMYFRIDPVTPRLEVSSVSMAADFATYSIYGVVVDTGSGMDYLRLSRVNTPDAGFSLVYGATEPVNYNFSGLSLSGDGFYVLTAQDRAQNTSSPQPRIQFSRSATGGIGPNMPNAVVHYVTEVQAEGAPCNISVTSSRNGFAIPVNYEIAGGNITTALTEATTAMVTVAVPNKYIHGDVKINVTQNCTTNNGVTTCVDACSVALKGTTVLASILGPAVAVSRYSDSPSRFNLTMKSVMADFTFENAEWDTWAPPAVNVTEAAPPRAPDGFVNYPPDLPRGWQIETIGLRYSQLSIKAYGLPSTMSDGDKSLVRLMKYHNGVPYDITTGFDENSIKGVTYDTSLFTLIAPLGMFDKQGPVTNLLLPQGTVHISTSAPLRLSAVDLSSNSYAVAGVATTYYLIDTAPTPGCFTVQSDTNAPKGSCANSVYSEAFTLSEGSYTVYAQSVDKLGNYGGSISTGVYVDGTPPETNISAGGAVLAAGATGYITAADSVTITAQDVLSNGVASDIAATYLLIDITQEECDYAEGLGGINGLGSCENPNYPGPFTLPEGEHVIYYGAVDKVGNRATGKSVTISVGRAMRVNLYPAVKSVFSVLWQWDLVESATGYQVFSSTGGALSGLLTGAATSYSQADLMPNTVYSNRLVAYTPNGAFESGFSAAATLANVPLAAESFLSGQNASVVIGQPGFYSNSSGAGPNRLSGPRGIALDTSGNLWVVDKYNSRILRFSPPFSDGMSADLVIGQTDLYLSLPPAYMAAYTLKSPQSIAFDNNGRMWVTDDGFNRALRFSPPFLNGMSADLVIGGANFYSGYGGAVSAKRICGQYLSAACDAAGNLWLSDGGCNRVLRFSPPLTNGMEANLVLGQGNFASYDGASWPPNNHSFDTPTAVTIDREGKLWVTDLFNDRVLEFEQPFTNGKDASQVVGQPHFTTNNDMSGLTQPVKNRLSRPTAADFDNMGNMYIADAGNSRVVQFKPPFSNGMDAALVIGQPDFNSRAAGASPAKLGGWFWDVEVKGFVYTDPHGRMWVSDSTNNRILLFNPGKNQTFSSIGNSSFTLQWDSSFNPPQTIYQAEISLLADFSSAITASGDINGFTHTFTGLAGGAKYYARVRAKNLDAVETVYLNLGYIQTAPLPVTGVAGVVVSSVSIIWNWQIDPQPAKYQVFSASGGALSGMLAEGTSWYLQIGLLPNTTYMCFVRALNESGSADSQMVAAVTNAAVPAFPPLLLNGQSADFVIGQANFISAVWGRSQSGIASAKDSVMDAGGNLWVVDESNCRILMFEPPFSAGMNAALVIGQPDFTSGVCGTGRNGLNSPRGAAFDGEGRLWVSDSSNNRVLMFNPPFSSGMAADLVIGQPDFASSSFANGLNSLGSPAALKFDGTGNLWVADQSNDRVIQFSPPFYSGMTAEFSIGYSVMPPTEYSLNDPLDLAFDGVGNLWVADGNTSRILKYIPPFRAGMNASVVIGQWDFASYWCSNGAPNVMCVPRSVDFDSAGNLYVSDANNHRVLIYKEPFSTAMNASMVLGQKDLYTRETAVSANRLSYPNNAAPGADKRIWVADGSSHKRVLGFRAYPFADVEKDSIIVRWLDAVNPAGTSYQVELSTAPSFSEIGFRTPWTGDSSHTIPGLTPETTYYARVKARNFAGMETEPRYLGDVTTLAAQKIYSRSDVLIGGNPEIGLKSMSQMSVSPADGQADGVRIAIASATAQDLISLSGIYNIGPEGYYDPPATLNFYYSSMAVTALGIPEAELAVYEYFSGTGWVKLDGQVSDAVNNKITVPITQIASLFGIFAGVRDWAAPVTEFTINGDSWTVVGGGLYVNARSSINLSAFDPVVRDTFSGVAFTEFRVDAATTASFALYSAPFSLSTGPHKVEFRSRDNAGNIEAVKAAAVFVDGLAPSSKYTVAGSSFISGGVLYAAIGSTITLVSSDIASGVKELSYGVNGSTYSVSSGTVEIVFSSGDVYAISYYATDNVDNSGGENFVSVYVDTTAPVSTLSLSGKTGRSGWYVPTVDVAIGALDDSSGIRAVFYSLDESSFTNYVSSFSVLSEGTHTIKTYSLDNVLNSESVRSSGFGIDISTPLVSYFHQPAANEEGWNNKPVDVVFTGTDTVSGIEYCSSSFTITGEGIGIPVSGYCADYAGWTSTVSFNVNIDTTAPSSNAEITAEHGLNGWLLSPAVITLISTDSLSGAAGLYYSVDGSSFALYSSSFSVGGEGEHLLKYYSADRAGNKEIEKELAFKLDVNAPLVGAVPGPVANNYGWNNTAVAVVFSGTDTISGLAYCAPEKIVDAEGSSRTITGYCSDYAGWSSTAALTISIDTTAPNLSYIADPASNEAGWNNSDVALKFTCADRLSGVKSCPADILLTGEGVNISTSGMVYDYAGNSKGILAAGVNIDKTAPLSTAAVSGIYRNGWYSSPITVVLASTDPASGIKGLLYSLDGAAYTAYMQPIVVSSEGNHNFSFYAEDMAGNKEPAKVIDFAIDTTAPMMDHLLDPPPNAGGWNSGSVNVVFRGSDTSSGVEECSSMTVAGEGKDQKAIGWCRDLAGNIAYSTATMNIDQTSPTITISSPAAGQIFVATRGNIYFGFGVQDNLDPAPVFGAFLVQTGDRGSPRGNRPAVIAVANGQSIEPLDIDDGIWRLTVSATDFADNTDTLSGGTFEVVHDVLAPRTALSTTGDKYQGAGPAPYVTARTTFTLSSIDDLVSAMDNSGLGVKKQSLSVGVDGIGSIRGLSFENASPRQGAIFASTFRLDQEADGIYGLSYNSGDVLGNIEKIIISTFIVDNTAPQTAFNRVSGPAYLNYVSTWTLFELAPIDPGAFASGVKETAYSINAAVVSTAPLKFTLPAADGGYLIKYRSKDNLENLEVEKSSSVFIDATPPVTSFNISEPLYLKDGARYITPASALTFAAADPLSNEVAAGVERIETAVDSGPWIKYTQALKFTEGRHTIKYRAIDNVGNVEAEHVLEVQCDNTAPASKWSVSSGDWIERGSKFYFNSLGRIALESADPLVNNVASGLENIYYGIDAAPAAKYTSLFGLAEGVRILNYKAIDNVGNTEVVKSTVIYVDATKPFTELTVSGDQYKNDRQYISRRTDILIAAADPVVNEVSVGVKATKYAVDSGGFSDYSQFKLSSEGKRLVSYYSADYVNNIETVKTAELWVDATAPSSALNIIGGRQYSGTEPGIFYASLATEYGFAAWDPVVAGGAAGVKKIEYADNGGALKIYAQPISLGEGKHTITYRSTDLVENIEVFKSTQIYVDNTAPVTAFNISEPLYIKDGVRYITPASGLTFTAADPLASEVASGVKLIETAIDSGPWLKYTQPLKFTEGRHSIKYRAIDNVGNVEAEHILEVQSDATAPVSRWLASGDRIEKGGKFYLNALGSIAFESADPVISAVASGVEGIYYGIDAVAKNKYSAPFGLAEGIRTVNFSAKDNVSNTEITKSTAVYVDGTKPQTELSLSGDQSHTDKQYISQRTDIVITAADPVVNEVFVGVKETKYTVDGGAFGDYSRFKLNTEGKRIVSFYSIDYVNNTEAVKAAELWVDNTAPATVLSISGVRYSAPGEEKIYLTKDSGIVLTPADPLSNDTASGVMLTKYRVDSGNWQVYLGSFTIAAEGLHTLEYYSLDRVRNAEPAHTLKLAVDNTPPASKLTTGRPKYELAGYTLVSAKTSLTLEAADPLSGGVASGLNAIYYSIGASPSVPYLTPFALTSRGMNIMRYWSVDNVQNAEPPSTASYELDDEPPVLKFDCPGESFKEICSIYNSTFTVYGTVSDKYMNSWRLEYAPGADAQGGYLPISSGSVNITTNAIGLFDPAGLDGAYTIRLSAVDLVENAAVKQVNIRIGKPSVQLSLGGRGGMFKEPEGAVVDGQGWIFVADTGNDRVAVYTSTGGFVRYYGAEEHAGKEKDDIPVALRLNEPAGLAVDKEGAVYVADTGNKRVVKLSPDGEIRLVIGGEEKRGHKTGGRGEDEDGGKNDLFHSPRGLALDAIGNIYVTDAKAGSIQKFGRDGKPLMRIVLPPVDEREKDEEGEKEEDENDPALAEPAGIAVDEAGSIYVADTKGGRLFKYGPAGGLLSVITGKAFKKPYGIAASPDGECVIVTDAGTGFIHKLDRKGRITLSFGREHPEDKEKHKDGISGPDDERHGSKTGKSGKEAEEEDRNDPLSTVFKKPGLAAFGPGGELYTSDRETGRIVKLGMPVAAPIVSPAGSIKGTFGKSAFARVSASVSALTGPDPAFRLGEVYVFPNPAKGADAPTFHIETGIADSVKITIYTVSGRTAHEYTLTGLPAELDDGNGLSYAYEYTWRGHIPTGVYLYYIEAQKAGQKLKKTGKFAVVR